MVRDINKEIKEMVKQLKKAKREGCLKITLPPGEGSSLNRVIGTKEEGKRFMKLLKSL